MKDLRFAVIGCGFWAQAQIAAWGELPGATLVAVCDRDRERVEATAQRFGVRAYVDAETMLKDERPDFIDIITDVLSHAFLAEMAARNGIDAITQKPMAPDLKSARRMRETARAAGAALYVHENFRWQPPLRRIGALLREGAIGEAFRGRLCFNSAFSVFDNQPNLADLEQFILTDVGAHVLDVARFLFCEARTLFCATRRINPRIRGEDVASVLMEMQSGAICSVELSFATRQERESFPQTTAFLEGQEGTLLLNLDGEIVVTTREGTVRERVTPPCHAWADPSYAAAHAGIVECNRDLLSALQGMNPAETTADDNFETLRLVFAAYASAREGRVIDLQSESGEEWEAKETKA